VLTLVRATVEELGVAEAHHTQCNASIAPAWPIALSASSTAQLPAKPLDISER
jgi:hypothetical protein